MKHKINSNFTNTSLLPLQVGSLTYTRKQLAWVFFWLIWGDICYMLMESVAPSILPLTLQKLGASNTAIGFIITTLPMFFSAVLNPIVSFRSDRFRSRFGRRIPFILFTLPFLVVSLITLGFSAQIGFWLYHQLAVTFNHISVITVSIWVVGVLMVVFTIFNTFVNSVFWYLFNDVIPEHLLARFMSWFRVVSMGSASIYNLVLFQYAGQHASAIISGVALLYFFGFGLMCLNVKEGTYPPTPALLGCKTGFRAAVETFAVECHGITHYWYQFLGTVFTAMAAGIAVFSLFFFESTGLNLAQIGQVNGFSNIAVAILIPLSGYLADHFHPLRVVIAGQLFNLFIVLPSSMVWFIWHPSPETAYWLWIFIGVGLSSPMNALTGVGDPPLLMRIFPRSRYGQFCSANAMWRSLGGILGGVSAGMFLDVIKTHVGKTRSYYFIPVWQLCFSIPVCFCILKLYQSWKRYGGDTEYVPPLPDRAMDEAIYHDDAGDEHTLH